MIDPDRTKREHVVNARCVGSDKYVVVIKEPDPSSATYEVSWEAWCYRVREELRQR